MYNLAVLYYKRNYFFKENNLEEESQEEADRNFTEEGNEYTASMIEYFIDCPYALSLL
jgi:hypothetical protein